MVVRVFCRNNNLIGQVQINVRLQWYSAVLQSTADTAGTKLLYKCYNKYTFKILIDPMHADFFSSFCFC